MGEILNALATDKIRVVILHGTRGVGETTLAKEGCKSSIRYTCCFVKYLLFNAQMVALNLVAKSIGFTTLHIYSNTTKTIILNS